MLHNPVAIFDSGVGSLSIVRELRKIIPGENILYFADRAHFPYGNKTHNALRNVMTGTVKYLEQYKPKVIIVASVTPSVQVLQEMNSVSRIPLMGIKPPLEEASRLTKKQHIGIMGTTGTIKSKEFDSEIKKRVPQNTFISKFDASQVIELIEEGIHISDERRTYDAIIRMVGESLDAKLDVMVLASTHLPFVRNYLANLMPGVKILDSSRNVAKVVKRSLASRGMLKKTGSGRLEILVSDKRREFERTLHNMAIVQPVKEVFLTF